jgi:hypothetical protein
MVKAIHCPCGFVVREEDEGLLVESAQSHARAAHGIELSRDQALAMAKPEAPDRSTNHGENPAV